MIVSSRACLLASNTAASVPALPNTSLRIASRLGLLSSSARLRLALVRLCSHSACASALSTGAPSSINTYCSGASTLPLNVTSSAWLVLLLPSLTLRLKLSLPLALRALSCQSLLG